LRIAERGDDEISVVLRSIFPEPPALSGRGSASRCELKMLGRRACPQIILAIENGKIFAKDFCCRIALDPGGRLIPACHSAVRVEHEDRVIFDPIDDEPKPFLLKLQRLLVVFSVCGVMEKNTDAGYRAVLIKDRGRHAVERSQPTADFEVELAVPTGPLGKNARSRLQELFGELGIEEGVFKTLPYDLALLQPILLKHRIARVLEPSIGGDLENRASDRIKNGSEAADLSLLEKR